MSHQEGMFKYDRSIQEIQEQHGATFFLMGLLPLLALAILAGLWLLGLGVSVLRHSIDEPEEQSAPSPSAFAADRLEGA